MGSEMCIRDRSYLSGRFNSLLRLTAHQFLCALSFLFISFPLLIKKIVYRFLLWWLADCTALLLLSVWIASNGNGFFSNAIVGIAVFFFLHWLAGKESFL